MDGFQTYLTQLLSFRRRSAICCIFSSPGQSPGRAIVLPPTLALALAAALAAAAALAKY